MEYTVKPRGICPRSLSFELEDNKLKNVRFVGGCNGNLQGLSVLVEGMSPEEVRAKLSGIRCGFKNTSCPDQLAEALNQILEAKE